MPPMYTDLNYLSIISYSDTFSNNILKFPITIRNGSERKGTLLGGLARLHENDYQLCVVHSGNL